MAVDSTRVDVPAANREGLTFRDWYRGAAGIARARPVVDELRVREAVAAWALAGGRTLTGEQAALCEAVLRGEEVSDARWQTGMEQHQGEGPEDVRGAEEAGVQQEQGGGHRQQLQQRELGLFLRPVRGRQEAVKKLILLGAGLAAAAVLRRWTEGRAATERMNRRGQRYGEIPASLRDLTVTVYTELPGERVRWDDYIANLPTTVEWVVEDGLRDPSPHAAYTVRDVVAERSQEGMTLDDLPLPDRHSDDLVGGDASVALPVNQEITGKVTVNGGPIDAEAWARLLAEARNRA